MKIVHFGDLHVWSRRMVWKESYVPKRWMGSLNLLIRRARKFPKPFREAALDAVLAEDADLVVFTGDFTNFSIRQEFAECADLFAPLVEKMGERLFAIPGNHDCYTSRSVREKLLEASLPWVCMDPVSRLDVNDRLTLLGVHHSVPLRFRSNGLVTETTQQALREAFNACREENRTVLLAGHFAYATPVEHPETPEHKLLGDDLFADLLREFSPSVYMHGHKHVRWAIRSSLTPDTLCLNCGSSSMKSKDPLKQAGFLSWDQQDDGTVENLQAHTYNGFDTWTKEPFPIREV